MSGQLSAAIALTDEVVAERWRQLKKFGEQHLPDGTGGYDVSAAVAKLNCDRATEDGTVTWRHVLEEEYFEAITERQWERLRPELIQIAAVCLSWIEDGDQRQLAANAEQSEEVGSDGQPEEAVA